MHLLESGEDYLETILMLKAQGRVRSIDIANHLNYSKPSVSIAMKKLKENGYIDIIDGYIELTGKGKEIAERIYERHEVLTNVLMSLGVNEKDARNDACKIEHDLSNESFLAIKNHYLLHKNKK